MPIAAATATAIGGVGPLRSVEIRAIKGPPTLSEPRLLLNRGACW
jgi:hypothetical protein